MYIMNEQEAIRRIKEHNEIHFATEYPRAQLITVALNMAIQALEKQVAKKPIMQSTDEKKIYKCPCCNKIFVEAYDTVQRGYIPMYCEMCGQAID